MKTKEIINAVKNKTNTTNTEIVNKLNDILDKSTSIQNLSNKLSRDSLRFLEVEQILNTMNYTLRAMPCTNPTSDIHTILRDHLSDEELKEFMQLLSDPRIAYDERMALRNKLIHSTKDPLLLTKEFIIKTYERLHTI